MYTKQTDVDPYIRVAGGLQFFLKRPDASMIRKKDIINALSKLCRYTGHTSAFYSVLEHSYWCARYWYDRRHYRAAWASLWHDATEAYYGDVTSPLKLLLPYYRELEDKCAAVIDKMFDCQFELFHKEVKWIDYQMYNVERRNLFTNCPVDPIADEWLTALDLNGLGCWLPAKAIDMFEWMERRLRQEIPNLPEVAV